MAELEVETAREGPKNGVSSHPRDCQAVAKTSFFAPISGATYVELRVADHDHLRELVAKVAAAYFANSHVSPGEVGLVMNEIAGSLTAIGSSPSEGITPPARGAKLTPEQIQDSITDEALVSFEDGRRYRTLRRHLTARGMTPEDYRAKWGLPDDYPMMSPNYSAMRSQLAKRPRGRVKQRSKGSSATT